MRPSKSENADPSTEIRNNVEEKLTIIHSECAKTECGFDHS